MNRPTFSINNRTYVSAGVIPYTMDSQDNYYFLLQHLTSDTRNWSYEDFGGKSQQGDDSIEAVAFRECHEETNFQPVFTSEFLQAQLKDERSMVYSIPECKYMMYLIYVPPSFRDLDLGQFGTSNNDGQPRVLEWLSYKSLMELDNTKLQPRFVPADFKINLPLILCHYRMFPGEKYF